jgi:predicted O-methyltransferase YrrM
MTLCASDSRAELVGSGLVNDDPTAPAPQRIDATTKAVADAAKGFMPEAEAEALWDAAWAMAPAGPILEVGTYCGKSAVWLGAAARLRGGNVVTVDHHHGSEENQAGWEHHDPELVDPRTGRMDTLPFFRVTIAAAGLEDTVTAVVATSTVAAGLWSTPLAMLFIDGGHAEAHASNDYGSWTPYLMPGGVLAIHDVFPDPADGGQAPFHIYQRALREDFAEIRRVGSLRLLGRPTPS